MRVNFENNYQCVVRLNRPISCISTVHTQNTNTRGTSVNKEEPFGNKPLSVLEKIRDNLERLNDKMEVMIELQKHGRKDTMQPFTDTPLDVMTLLSMPDHLRKTPSTI